MDVWSHEERYNQKLTCKRVSKSSTSDKEGMVMLENG